MITNTIKFIGSRTAPNPIEIDYWIDTKTDPYGTAIKYHNGIDWVNLFKHDNIDIDLANYYTKKQVDSKLSIKADINTVNNMFSTLNDTKADKTSTYTKSEINTLFLNFDPFDETKYYTKVEIDTKGYLTEVPAQYITEDELSLYTYNKDNIDSVFATKTYVTEEITKASLGGEIDLTGYATEQWVEDKNYLTEHQSLEEYAKKSDIPDVSEFIKEIPSEYITEEELNGKGYLTSIPDTYVTDGELSTAISDKVSQTALNEAIEGVENKIPSLDGYATEQWVEETIAGMESGEVDHTVFALKTDLEGLASTQYVDEKIDAIEHPTVDLTGYATEEWVEAEIAKIEPGSNVDVSTLATKTELTNVETKIPTDSTIALWGYTKNTGTYSKPNDGIPVSDLSEDIQNLLEKANNSLQDVPMASSEEYGGVTANEKTSDYTTEVKIDSSTGILYVPEINQISPDEEDVTVDTIGEEKILKFNDKEYDKNSYSGLGRKYLRKNIVNGVNILTLTAFTNDDGTEGTNTRYIIQYDYDLNGDTITIPEGCVLDFQGGSFRNGSVTGTNYSIAADSNAYIFQNVVIDNISKVYAAWFGVSSENEDNSSFLNNALKNMSLTYSGNRTVIFGSGVFKIKNTVEIAGTNIIGATPVQKLNGNKDAEYKTIFQLEHDGTLFSVKNTSDMLYGVATTYIENCMFRCMSKATYPNSIAISAYIATLNMTNCIIYNFVIGLELYGLISSEFYKVDLGYNANAISFKRGENISTSTWFRRCYIYESNIHFQNEAESVLDCHFNACIFESAKTQSFKINPYGFSVMHLSDCYSENNRTIPENSKYEIEILPVKLTDSIYFKLSSIGNIWAGQNFGTDKWGTFIKINAGTFYSYGDTFTRYNYAMEIDDTTAAKINVNFNSFIFSGGIAALDESNSNISVARTNLYMYTCAGDGRQVQTSIPQINLQLRDNIYPVMGLSAERDVALTRYASVLKSKTAGYLRIYDNNLLAIGPKKRIGDIKNAISLPVNNTVSNIVAANAEQAFLRIAKTEAGATVPYFSYSTDTESEFTNDWTHRIIPLLLFSNTYPVSNLKEGTLLINRNNGGVFAYSHYWAKNINIADGYPAVSRKGTFADKPAASSELAGMDYYCTDTKKKILCNGSEWVNVDGTSLV